jgi:hypothetical protein
MGNVHVRNPNDLRNGKKHNKGLQHPIAGYLSKYISKDMHDHNLNAKRYCRVGASWYRKRITTSCRMDALSRKLMHTSCRSPQITITMG